MTNKRKVLGFLGCGTGAFRPFDQVFDAGERIVPAEVANVDALVIWGGEDISTGLYGEDGGVWTGADRELSARDKLESDAVNEAVRLGKPIIGVCRGAQLLCAMAGGKLVQHVDNHNRGDHYMQTSDGRVMEVTSLHHQMMWPFAVEHKMLGWSKHNLSNRYAFNAARVKTAMEVKEVEPEVVYFPTIKGLALQFHPEFANPADEQVQYTMELVREYCL